MEWRNYSDESNYFNGMNSLGLVVCSLQTIVQSHEGNVFFFFLIYVNLENRAFISCFVIQHCIVDPSLLGIHCI